MIRSIPIAFVVATLLAAPCVTAATQKFALVVGNNTGSRNKDPLLFAEKDAEKLRATLIDVGGFSVDNAILLLGKTATQVQQAFALIDESIAQIKETTGERTLFVFYYSGHAEHGKIELGDTSMDVDTLRLFLTDSSADVRLAFLDSCESGSLIQQKGGSRGRYFKIRVTDAITSNGYAIITSSADNEVSHESHELRGGFFTHHLISALRGAADDTGDGRVTLNEAYQYTYKHTLSQTSTTVGVSQHPMYHFQLKGRGDIVLADSRIPSARLSVSLPESGRLFLMNREVSSILAESEMIANREAQFSLRHGTYLVYLVTKEGQVRSADVTVPDSGNVHIGVQDFNTVQLKQSVARGGLFHGPPEHERWRQQLSAGALVRSFPLEGAAAAYGAVLIYRINRKDSVEPQLKLTWATRGDVDLSTGYNEFGVGLGLGYPWYFRDFVFRVAVHGSFEYLSQDDREDNSRRSAGFGYLLSVGGEYRFSQLIVGLDVGYGGRVFLVKSEDAQAVHRFDLQGALTLGWRFR